ncbi:uncharacterized protein N7477_003024 [Penicillium maclennaniae]|uniref:uncharacterized protein n=1 Tax=Penicillium maclennaniae TaxID=1343394 RepID=UPI00254102B4|nr:uncharacterized protein N7477_003024 [Penicillium maclennaniae]KAJ5677391.1 hypothetical protein N7477_003024 [Penicillium maclennaniae]
MASRKCAAVVVGAGPAGVAVMGNLLERQIGTIAWIDPSFESGRVHRKYREVPSPLPGLRHSYSALQDRHRELMSSQCISTLAKLDQEKTCHLHYAADMIRDLTDGLIKMDPVHAYRGFVTAANLVEKTSNNKWTVRIKRHDSEDELEIETSRLILCTGSHPTKIPVPIPGLEISRLDLDTVLKPSELAEVLPKSRPSTVAVIGASHSAILAILNLVTLARESHPHLRIKWFTRHPLRYAEYMDGWILRDNTGLKGLAADFARAQLEDGVLDTSPAGQVLEKIDCGDGKEAEMYSKYLPQCSHIVHAVGFTRDPLPQLVKAGRPFAMEFDHESGQFHERAGGEAIPGLFGAGIAFPERVVDPYGNVEYAVGFFKFMKFLKRVTPNWGPA